MPSWPPVLKGWGHAGPKHSREGLDWGPITAQFMAIDEGDRGNIGVRGVPEEPACRDLPPGDRGPGLMSLHDAIALHHVLGLALKDATAPRTPPRSN